MSDAPKQEPEKFPGAGGYGIWGYGTGAYGGLRTIYKIPASETPEGKGRIRAYYEALGRFVDMFSRIETAITFTLRAYAKTDATIGNVIFSGTQMKIGMTYIKQLAEATRAFENLRIDLNEIFQQLGIITGVRNDILHYGAVAIAEGAGIVSDEIRAKGEPKTFPISNTALDDMTEDLDKIATHLNYRHLGRTPPLGAFGKAALEDILQRAWRYKHPGPPKGRSRTAVTQPQKARSRKQPRPPQA